MTASCCQTTETLGESIAAALREKKPVMLASLAERFGVSELEVARALPDEARAFAGKDAFDTVWQALTSWENATFIMGASGLRHRNQGKDTGRQARARLFQPVRRQRTRRASQDR